MKKLIFLIVCMLTFAFGMNVSAHNCSYKNTAFKSGEHLSYTLL